MAARISSHSEMYEMAAFLRYRGNEPPALSSATNSGRMSRYVAAIFCVEIMRRLATSSIILLQRRHFLLNLRMTNNTKLYFNTKACFYSRFDFGMSKLWMMPLGRQSLCILRRLY